MVFKGFCLIASKALLVFTLLGIGGPIQALADEHEPLTEEPVSQQTDAAQTEAAEDEFPVRSEIPDIDAKGRPGLIPTSAFAGRSAFYDAKLSPDGSKFAFRQKLSGVNLVVVVDAETRESIASFTSKGIGNVKWFRWAGNDQILFSLGKRNFIIGSYVFALVDRTEMRVFDLKDKSTRAIAFEKQGYEGDDLLYVDPAGEYIIWSVSKEAFKEPNVWRFPLNGSGEDGAVLVQKRLGKVDEWWADDTGAVRLGMGFTSGGSAIVYYRPDGQSKMERITKLKRGSDELKEWNARSIFAGSDEGYAFIEGEDGRTELRRFNYSTATPTSLVYANKDWGVDYAIMDRSGKPLGVTYTGDKMQTVWFDDVFKREQRKLEQALGVSDVQILSFARDERMLVYAGSAGDPGALYIYTPGEKRIDLFADYRPAVDYRLLAEPKAITYQAQDGTDIRAFLTLPRGRGERDLPLIILPHGGPFGVRDELAYSDEVQLLANRGYAVLQPNFRGSGGYGDSFLELGAGEVGRTMQDDLDDAMDWAVAEGIADPARVCVVGGSYGGYAATWAVLRNPERYRCAASWAGVMDWRKMLKYDRNYLARSVNKEWRRVIKGEDRKTRDLDGVSPYRHANRLARPLLLAHGTKDERVPFSQYEIMVEASADSRELLTLLEIEGEGHAFSEKANEQKWYDALEAFLAQHNPSDVNTNAAVER